MQIGGAGALNHVVLGDPSQRMLCSVRACRNGVRRDATRLLHDPRVRAFCGGMEVAGVGTDCGCILTSWELQRSRARGRSAQEQPAPGSATEQPQAPAIQATPFIDAQDQAKFKLL